MTKHTPTPWNYSGNLVCSQINYEESVLVCETYEKNDMQSHNAALIVKAVNNFDSLFEVVEAMANFDGRNNSTHLKEMAREALAKASQKPIIF